MTRRERFYYYYLIEIKPQSSSSTLALIEIEDQPCIFSSDPIKPTYQFLNLFIVSISVNANQPNTNSIIIKLVVRGGGSEGKEFLNSSQRHHLHHSSSRAVQSFQQSASISIFGEQVFNSICYFSIILPSSLLTFLIFINSEFSTAPLTAQQIFTIHSHFI